MGLNSLGLGFVFTAKDLASGVIGKVGDAFQSLDKTAQKAMKGVSDGLAEASLGLKVMGKGLGALSTLTGLAAHAKDLNYGLREMEFYAKGTGDQLEAMNQAVFDASVSTKGFNANEAALAMGRLSNFTNDAKKSMELLSPTLTLMRISGMEAAEAAKYLTKTIAALGLEAKDANRVNDLLVFGARNFGLTVRESADGLSQLKQNIRLTKTSMEDTFIAFGLMAKGGQDAASAASAVNEILQKMTDPKVGLGLAKLPDNFAGIPGGISKAKGGFRSVLDVLDTVYARFGSLSDKALAFRLRQTFHGAAGGVLSALTVLKDGVKDIYGNTHQGANAIAYLRQEAQKRGAAEEMAKKFTTASQIINASLDNLKIAIGKPFADAIKPFAEIMARGIQRVVKFLMSIPAPIKQSVATFLLLAAGAVAAFGAFIALKGALLLVGFGLKLIAGAIVGALFTFAPLLLSFAAAIAIFEAFRKAYDDNLGGFADFVDKVVKKVRLLWDGFIQAFSEGGFSGAVRDELRKTENLGLRQFIVDVYAFVTRVRAAWGGLTSAFSEGLEAAEPVFAAFRNSIEVLGRVLGFFSDTSTKASITTSTFVSVGRSIGDALAFVVEHAAAAATRIADFAAGLVVGFKMIVNYLRPSFVGLVEAVGPLWEAIKNLLGTFSQLFGVTSAGQNDLRGLGVIVGAVLGTALGILADALQIAVRMLTQLIREAQVFAENLIAVGKFAVDVGSTLVDLFLNPQKTLKEFATGLRTLLRPAFDWLLGVMDTVRSGFDQLLVYIANLAAKIPARFRPAGLTGLIEAGRSAAERVAGRQGVGAGAEAGPGGLVSPSPAIGAPGRVGVPIPLAPISPAFTAASAPLQSLPAVAQSQAAANASFTPEDFAKAIGKEMSAQPVNISLESKLDGEKLNEALIKTAKNGKQREAISQSF